MFNWRRHANISPWRLVALVLISQLRCRINDLFLTSRLNFIFDVEPIASNWWCYTDLSFSISNWKLIDDVVQILTFNVESKANWWSPANISFSISKPWKTDNVLPISNLKFEINSKILWWPPHWKMPISTLNEWKSVFPNGMSVCLNTNTIHIWPQ